MSASKKLLSWTGRRNSVDKSSPNDDASMISDSASVSSEVSWSGTEKNAFMSKFIQLGTDNG